MVNPWLSNGRNDFRSLDRIVARAIEPGMTDREKARALWWQEVQHRFHFEGDNDELLDPVKVFNVYGYNTCGNDSICLAGLWRKAGLKVAPARLVGHCVTQVFYDGSWHLMDGDMHSIYLLRDNETIAGEQDLVRDHDLIRRTHTQGILQPDRRSGDEWESSIYVFEGKVTGDRNSAESDLEHDAASRRGDRVALGASDPGQVSRAPAAPVPRPALQWAVGIPPRLHAALLARGRHRGRLDPGGRRRAHGGGRERPAVSSGRCRSPYVFVGGRLEVEGTGAKFKLSWDGKSWHEVDRNLDGLFPPEGPARYRYYLKCELSGDAQLRRLGIVNDLQMAPLTLPGMGVGIERVHLHRRVARAGAGCGSLTSGSSGPRAVRPKRPPNRSFRPPEESAEGTEIVFQWRPASRSRRRRDRRLPLRALRRAPT